MNCFTKKFFRNKIMRFFVAHGTPGIMTGKNEEVSQIERFGRVLLVYPSSLTSKNHPVILLDTSRGNNDY